MRADIDQLLTNQYLDNDHVDAFAILLSEKNKFIIDMYHPYLYISPMHRVYKNYKNSSNLFFQHINKNSVKESNLLIMLIINCRHWTLFVGRLKEKINKLYNEMEEYFESDLTK
ncbi:hypothetical protein IEQ34_013576 [Dendrobium chrysotoxum]|uniref:Ubiquitin-like protease family profile domain-containing protein n=1 Tax=Dendrobium chrysotoxum TaxID=161865 RepID=A0AAV7GNW2_DENCH|nr:hypothetical protein IEQ34_013576 [Dendrobium chrysotoxum]